MATEAAGGQEQIGATVEAGGNAAPAHDRTEHVLLRCSCRSKKQFETWAVMRIGFIPQEKKGADGGLDGVEWFGPKREYKAIVSVKGGKAVGVEMLRSLDAVITQQGAQVGVFLTLEKPTSKMLDWAKQAGMFEAPGFAPVPRIQIVTVEQAIAARARAVNLPARHSDTFKKPAREEDARRQGALDL